MNAHKNARTIPFGRAVMVRRVLHEGGSVAASAAVFEVSTRTVRKWLARLRRVGHRITGDRRQGSDGAGWELVHVAVDDASHPAHVEVLPDEKRQSATGFLVRAPRRYKSQRIRVERAMTDNGPGYVSRLCKKACRRLRLRHIRTRAYTPETNGRAARLIPTLLREWVYALPYPTSEARAADLPRWLRHHNHERSRASLARRSPTTWFQARSSTTSPESTAGTIEACPSAVRVEIGSRPRIHVDLRAGTSPTTSRANPPSSASCHPPPSSASPRPRLRRAVQSHARDVGPPLRHHRRAAPGAARVQRHRPPHPDRRAPRLSDPTAVRAAQLAPLPAAA